MLVFAVLICMITVTEYLKKLRLYIYVFADKCFLNGKNYKQTLEIKWKTIIGFN